MSRIVVPARLITVRTTIPGLVDLTVHTDTSRLEFGMTVYSTGDVIRRLELARERAADPHDFAPLHLDPMVAHPVHSHSGCRGEP
ncbi:hypothetical protein [Embleya sp. NPDC020630]|uniref:hypothetical protein n=1 Tax=Embleya sp. NPDC020630 TaxID=3363979 RepID=UPI00378CF1EB